MRVLIVTDVTGYMLGGVPTETVQLVRGLTSRGHAVWLAADVVPRGAEAARHLPLSVPTGVTLRGELRHALESAAPDVVHVMAMSSRGVVRIAPLLAAWPWVLTCHSLPPYERKLPGLHGTETLHYAMRRWVFWPHAMAWRWLLRRGLVRQAVVHSEARRRVLLSYGQDAGRCTLIPLGCDPVLADAAMAQKAIGPAPRIVTIGGLAHTKGLHDGIEALCAVHRRHRLVRWQIIGELRDASYWRHLEKLIVRHGLRERVLITANVPHEDKMRALREADLYLQPSHEEGFCLAYIEAAGVVPRLVGADTGAIRAIGEGDPGARTVPPRDPAKLAEAMLELFAAELPPDLMTRREARLAARFSWAQYLDAHEALYRQVASAATVARASAA